MHIFTVLKHDRAWSANLILFYGKDPPGMHKIDLITIFIQLCLIWPGSLYALAGGDSIRIDPHFDPWIFLEIAYDFRRKAYLF